jgi:hypothetical protein
LKFHEGHRGVIPLIPTPLNKRGGDYQKAEIEALLKHIDKSSPLLSSRGLGLFDVGGGDAARAVG